MYCRNCGNKLNDGARFCTKCGTKVEWQGTEPEQQNTEPETIEKESVNKKRPHNLRKIITVVFAGVFVLLVVKNIMSRKEQADLSSGRSTDIMAEAETDANAKTENDTQTETDVKKVTDEAAETETKNNTKTRSEEFQEYIEKTYGIAEDYILAESITQSETISGTVTNSTSEKFKEGSHGGSLLYKKVTSQNGTEGGISVYLHEDENNHISLSATYLPDTENGSYTVDLASPKDYNTCSVIVGEDYFASIEQEEGTEDATGQWIYKEKITVRELAPGNVTELYTVSRKFTMDVPSLKECIIKKGSEVEMYVEGYGSYTADGATFLSTEDEFNNKANDLFKEKFLDCIRLNKLSIDSTYSKSMNVINANASRYGIVKVNFYSDDPYVDENGDTVTDINIDVIK